MATLKCEIVTPVRKIFTCDATFVVLPGAEGEMGVLPQHAPTVTTLRAGSCRVTAEGETQARKFAVAGGYAQIEGDRVIILADRAISVDEIDVPAVTAELNEVKYRLDTPEEANNAFLQGEKAWYELLIAQA